jgi:serine/threonine protein kinase
MEGVVTSGDRIGHYRVLQTLGEGGMGVVYLGADPEGRNVAIKVLRPQVAGDATARRRLAREVDSMRRVHSPHVAEILDADVTADQPYIVTQYVPGRTLEEIVEEHGPIYGQALQRLATGLAKALSAIHGAGIVHRDLKPGNVMLVDSEPVVIDFGIAQGADATRLTATGMVIGTPGYLAPEIIEGEDAGPASDVHAWAGTVAYAATGRPPFGSGTFESIFFKIMQGTPDLDGMPAPILPVVRSAMARHPAERPTAVNLVQLTRRIQLEATITDQTRVDEHYTRPDTGRSVPSSAESKAPTDHAQQFAMPAAASAASAPSEATAADGTTGDAEVTLPESSGPRPSPVSSSGSGSVPAPAPAPAPVPMPAPVPAQPKDFKGLLPPAAPPPGPPPPPGAYESGTYESSSAYDQQGGYAPPYQRQPNTRPRRGGLPPQPPPGPPAPYDERAPYDPYGGGTQPRPAEPPQRRDDRGRRDRPDRPDRHGEGEQRPKPYGWYRVLSLIVLIALLGFAGIAPLLAVAVTGIGVLILRAGDKAAKGMEGKRTRRGPRSGDAVAATLKSPLHLPGAIVVTALLGGLAAFAGLLVLGGLMFAYPDMTASRAISYGSMVVIVLLCLAPGSGAPRRQMARLWGAMLPRAEVALGGALILGIFAGVLVALSQKQPPDTTPLNGMSQSLESLRSDVRDLVDRLPGR